jgi:HEPN domain-containing protein
VYLTLQKDLTSIRIEYIQDQYPEDKAPEEYYAEMDTDEFLEVLNFWWENYSGYLKKVSK